MDFKNCKLLSLSLVYLKLIAFNVKLTNIMFKYMLVLSHLCFSACVLLITLLL